jgi:hypothetical protein
MPPYQFRLTPPQSISEGKMMIFVSGKQNRIYGCGADFSAAASALPATADNPDETQDRSHHDPLTRNNADGASAK